MRACRAAPRQAAYAGSLGSIPHQISRGRRGKAKLRARALSAILLLVGFYILALVIAGVLAYLPYAEWHYADRIDGRLLFFGVGGAIAILAAIMPRVDRFEAPGPLLKPEEQPRLFRLIEETAVATNQAPPKHVFLVPDLNAWVAQRGGVMGFGAERTMGVGLPLLQALNVQEFRAVLAHEFGHYHGGDTALGPWIYKTRAAIGRTLGNLSRNHGWIGKPFEWYGTMFLRITHAASREQEYAADAIAAGVAGGAALVSGLKVIHAAGPAFPPYWSNEVAPALAAGIRPPILDGFRHFLAAPAVAESVAAQLETQLAGEATDPFDTHPPLKDRIAAIDQSLSAVVPSETPLAAVSLLADPDRLEAELVAHLLPKDLNAKLTYGGWEDVGPRVWLPRWQKIVAENRARLTGLTAEELVAFADPPAALAVRLKLAATPEVASPKHVAEGQFLIGALVAVVLDRLGFRIAAMRERPSSSPAVASPSSRLR